MKHNPPSVVANTGLALMAVALLVGPLAVGQLVGSYQSGALGESTVVGQGALSVTGNFQVQTNAEEFTPYVEFDPNPVQDAGFYQTSITLTSFTKQQAAYNSLLLLTNTGVSPIKLQAQTGTMSGVMEHSEVWVSLTTADGAASTLTTQKAQSGQRQLQVGQNSGFDQGHVVVDGQILRGSAAGKSVINLVQPLSKTIEVGQRVYLGAAFYQKLAEPKQANTSVVTLEPGQQAGLSVVVATAEGELDTNQLVIPVTVVEVR